MPALIDVMSNPNSLFLTNMPSICLGMFG